jgi:hypothetical protein
MIITIVNPRKQVDIFNTLTASPLPISSTSPIELIDSPIKAPKEEIRFHLCHIPWIKIIAIKVPFDVMIPQWGLLRHHQTHSSGVAPLFAEAGIATVNISIGSGARSCYPLLLRFRCFDKTSPPFGQVFVQISVFSF